jgi:sugar phosphate isomerase/epimerase
MKIGLAAGIATHSGSPLSALRPVLANAASLGASHVELRTKALGVIVNGQLHPARLAALRDAIADSPVRFTAHGSRVGSAIVGNLFDTSTPAQRASVEADLALAGALGAEVLVHHSGLLRDPYGDDRAVAAGLAAERDALRALGDVAGRLGVRIAVENLDPVATYVSRRAYGLRLDALAEQVVAIDHPSVGICLDLGHAFLGASYLGFDFLAAVRDVAPLVSHIHLHDNFGVVELNDTVDPNDSLILGDGDLHLPPGWGSIPFDDVFAQPFPREPIVTLELRAQFAEHAADAIGTIRAILTRADALTNSPSGPARL